MTYKIKGSKKSSKKKTETTEADWMEALDKIECDCTGCQHYDHVMESMPYVPNACEKYERAKELGIDMELYTPPLTTKRKDAEFSLPPAEKLPANFFAEGSNRPSKVLNRETSKSSSKKRYRTNAKQKTHSTKLEPMKLYTDSTKDWEAELDKIQCGCKGCQLYAHVMDNMPYVPNSCEQYQRAKELGTGMALYTPPLSTKRKDAKFVQPPVDKLPANFFAEGSNQSSKKLQKLSEKNQNITKATPKSNTSAGMKLYTDSTKDWEAELDKIQCGCKGCQLYAHVMDNMPYVPNSCEQYQRAKELGTGMALYTPPLSIKRKDAKFVQPPVEKLPANFFAEGSSQPAKKTIRDSSKSSKLNRESSKSSKLNRESSKSSKLKRESSKSSNLGKESSKSSKLGKESSKSSKLEKESSKSSKMESESSKSSKMDSGSSKSSKMDSGSSKSSKMDSGSSKSSKMDSGSSKSSKIVGRPNKSSNLNRESSKSSKIVDRPDKSSKQNRESSKSSKIVDGQKKSSDLHRESSKSSKIQRDSSKSSHKNKKIGHNNNSSGTKGRSAQDWRSELDKVAWKDSNQSSKKLIRESSKSSKKRRKSSKSGQSSHKDSGSSQSSKKTSLTSTSVGSGMRLFEDSGETRNSAGGRVYDLEEKDEAGGCRCC